MKKLIISLVFLGIMFSPVAQAATQQELVQQISLLQQIVVLLQKIESLKQQLAQALSAQNIPIQAEPQAVTPSILEGDSVVAPTCTITGVEVPDPYAKSKAKVEWTSTDATSGDIQGNFHGSNPSKFQEIKSVTDNVSQGSYQGFLYFPGTDLKATFTGPGGSVTCSGLIP